MLCTKNIAKMLQNASKLYRFNSMQRILANFNANRAVIQACFVSSFPEHGTITIDGISMQLKAPKQPLYVPHKFLKITENGQLDVPQTIVHHLRWMLQKDLLGQDMFLIGRPGPLRRIITMQYVQLTQRELEYVSLSRDTTENDLKQRREILNGTAQYFDQCAVRAAIHGRVLVIEGIEKAERNVLPVLNNLLENREMHLEDGRFLIPAERYDSLLAVCGPNEMEKSKLVRVSEDFRVIALGLSVPRYHGTPLDPPLRSRFQARDVTNLSYQETLNEMHHNAPQAAVDVLEKIASFGYAIESSSLALTAAASTQLGQALFDFPCHNLKSIAKMIESNPAMCAATAIQRLYPHRVFPTSSSHSAVTTLADALKITDEHNKRQRIIGVERLQSSVTETATSEKNQLCNVNIEVDDGNVISLQIHIGNDDFTSNNNGSQRLFVETNYHNSLLAELIQSYAIGDVCLIGSRGSGKSMLVSEIARLLRKTCEPMVLYQDMTTRDFLQQRTTTASGNTVWHDSPLVRAAKNGSIAILDGIHRIHGSTLSIVHRLVHDRELQLYDGTRLIRHDKFDEFISNGWTEEALAASNVHKIHPSFRIIALAEPPKSDSNANWLTPEVLSLFIFHDIRNLSRAEELHITESMFGKPGPSMEKILNLAERLRLSKDPMVQNLATTLTTRQLIRIAHRLSVYSSVSATDDDIAYDTIQRAFLSKFLPAVPRATLENVIRNVGISPSSNGDQANATIEIVDNVLTIGSTSTKLFETNELSMVPEILFYDVPQHVQLLERLLQDFLLGNHLLLVGNQGVGKNKIADRFLQLMNRPRIYIQLHRDTTVQALTIQPTVRDGIVVYEDSPLVKAVRDGHVLVVDEADKAPTHVTCILKTFVENGAMVLSDGRKILPQPRDGAPVSTPNVIYTHPNFRMIVLANRPGFPFLGNDFFASLGDLFSCHSVDNPSIESELYLLKQYGPDVDDVILSRLVNAFAELRSMADIGQLNYPYSAREVVNIVRHLQRYPNEDINELIGNVLDFDRHSPDALDQVTEVLKKHGLAIEAYAKDELTAIRAQKQIQVTVEHASGKSVSAPKHGKDDPDNKPHVGGNTWAGGTGGRDTAGLGGKGGPYRLDKGHKVHQLSDREKDDIPDHVKKAAREMNRKAFADKLKEIKMSAYDHSVYDAYSTPVRKQVQQLRVILSSLQAKSKERLWQRHQTSGELDDTKLIEGITGERNIYRKRSEQEPEPGHPQNKPKRLRLVVDVSGSMYRFNGYDQRLDRELEAVVMVMEAFEGYETRVQYDIVGHSGESEAIPFVDAKSPPVNAKQRLETIKMMHAHSQFCWSGDNTVAAAKRAIDSLAKEDTDESIVVVLSDANLSRYNISPKSLASALASQDSKVQAYAIFIGSLENEAQMITRSLPAGRGFVCLDVRELPQILKQIFASSVLHQSNSLNR